jgi:hypothetical protein
MNGMHVWLNLLKQNFPEDLRNVTIDRAGYVRRQSMRVVYAEETADDYRWRIHAQSGLLSFLTGLPCCLLRGTKSWERLSHLLSVDRKNSRSGSVAGSTASRWNNGHPSVCALVGEQEEGFLSGDLRNCVSAMYLADLEMPGIGAGSCITRKRKLNFEIADPERSYDVVVLSERADVSVWGAYRKGKLVYDLIDSYLAIPEITSGRLRGLAKFVSRQSRYLTARLLEGARSHVQASRRRDLHDGRAKA